MAKPKQKVVITCAVTGAIHTPSMSPHLPVTADEIAEAAIGAAKAGAAPAHDGGRAHAPGYDLPARTGFAEHGVDELRPVPDAGPLPGLQA
ncbi:hypothetical protein G6F65_022480 [Rhizopus arrhizus]|nr:hypothetical protein G6F65_022480 [Rhizopus arrhizus]